MGTEEQENTQEEEESGIWKAIHVSGVFLIIGAIIGGLAIANEEGEFSSIISLALIVQGIITGMLFMGFAKMGTLLEKIQQKIAGENKD